MSFPAIATIRLGHRNWAICDASDRLQLGSTGYFIVLAEGFRTAADARLNVGYARRNGFKSADEIKQALGLIRVSSASK